MKKEELVKALNCDSIEDAIKKLENLISSLDVEILEVNSNPAYLNVRTTKVNFLGSKKMQAQSFLNTLNK